MKVKVRVLGDLSRIYGVNHVVDAEEGSSVSFIIRKIQERAGVAPSIYLGDWQVGSPDLVIIINGKNVNLIHGLETQVHENDDIVITTFAEGG